MTDPVKAEIVLYQSEGANVPVQVRYIAETLWMPQKEMAELFGKDKSTISRHLRNIFDSGELDEQSVVADFATTAADGKTNNSKCLIFAFPAGSPPAETRFTNAASVENPAHKVAFGIRLG